MSSLRDSFLRTWVRLRAEPLVHFFLAGALLFALQHWLVGDPRTIVVTPGVKSAVSRHFEDRVGRKPDAAELETELRQWERDEALFREAQRQRLERDDPGIRTAFVNAMQVIAASQVPERTPTDAELERWLGAHRERYEMPLRYDFEYLEFPKGESDARGELARFERAIHAGAGPATLGRPLIGGKLSVADMQGRIAPELAARIPSLTPGQWQNIETEQSLLLARVKRSDGGLPSLEALRPRLVADWTQTTRQEAVDRVLQETVDRYRVEERP